MIFFGFNYIIIVIIKNNKNKISMAEDLNLNYDILQVSENVYIRLFFSSGHAISRSCVGAFYCHKDGSIHRSRPLKIEQVLELFKGKEEKLLPYTNQAGSCISPLGKKNIVVVLHFGRIRLGMRIYRHRFLRGPTIERELLIEEFRKEFGDETTQEIMDNHTLGLTISLYPPSL